MRYQIQMWKSDGAFSIVSGCGKNRGTWDSDHSRSAAYHHAAIFRKEISEGKCVPSLIGATLRVVPMYTDGD